MNVGQVFIAMIGLTMAFGVYLLMRHPQYRRMQFRNYGAFSVKASLSGAIALLIVIALMILCQGNSNYPTT